MTAKRILLWGLTFVAIAAITFDLIGSWSQPQFQSRLELAQNDLLLEAAEYRGNQTTPVLTDRTPQKTALKAYQDTRSSVEKAIVSAQSQIEEDSATDPIKVELAKQQTLRDELDIRIGILQTQQNQVEAALKSWATLKTTGSQTKKSSELRSTATTLTALWQNSLPPQAESILKQNLNGWFRNRALEKLYTLEQRETALNELRSLEQVEAQPALAKWVTANAIPTVAMVLGFGLLLFLAGQWLLQRKQSLLLGTNLIKWNVPWDYEITWQVLVVGFFAVGQILIGQILLPTGLAVAKSAFQIDPTMFTVRDRAVLALITYVCLAAGGLGVLYASIKRFLSLEDNWFRFSLKGKWLLWGVGGYVAAYPLLVGVSWVNEKIWQGRGGSNPLLSIALEGQDGIAITLFFITAAILAPLFEETFFRGFLLPSLTRYFTTWQAIVLSGLIFAIVHLSLSEVAPLTVLGIILGFVYTRTQNLMASVLLHALWNSGTLLTLFLLGSTST